MTDPIEVTKDGVIYDAYVINGQITMYPHAVPAGGIRPLMDNFPIICLSTTYEGILCTSCMKGVSGQCSDSIMPMDQGTRCWNFNMRRN